MSKAMLKGHDEKLTAVELAEVLYEGTPHLENLAEKLVRHHGEAEALTFFNMMPKRTQDFWVSIAEQLIAHSKLYGKHGFKSCDETKESSPREGGAK